MKKYIGTKQVVAEPMAMGEAYRRGLLQAGRVPSLAECAQAGYHVIYESGYGSWSPADVFGKAYRVADTFIDRLHIELDDLRGAVRQGARLPGLPGVGEAAVACRKACTGRAGGFDGSVHPGAGRTDQLG